MVKKSIKSQMVKLILQQERGTHAGIWTHGDQCNCSKVDLPTAIKESKMMIELCNKYFNRDKDYICIVSYMRPRYALLVNCFGLNTQSPHFLFYEIVSWGSVICLFGSRIFPTWENSIFSMRNQKRSETIFLQYCMFNILPILNFKDFSYCCNFEHNYPDQKIKKTVKVFH